MRAGSRFDFAAFVGWLDERGVRYMLIGGHAVRAYGSPRFTHDFDFWFDPASRSAVLVHLEDRFDMELSADPADLRRPIVIGTSERDKIDCFFVRGLAHPDGNHLDFDEVHGRSVLMAGSRPPPIRVPCIRDLIRLKQLRTSPKPGDLADIDFLRVREHLEETGGEP